ncbi:hypothetical protein G9A89_021431 [Geosiphon pyriformis]|nr:hypothetical protein G9A89_021431 [Geosiphon pyriformis]
MAVSDLFSVMVAGEILLILGFLMSFEWGFGVAFELVVGADKLFGVAADRLLVAVVDKLEVDILVVDRLVVVSLANGLANWFNWWLIDDDNWSLNIRGSKFQVFKDRVLIKSKLESNTGYDLRYPGKDTLVLQPKSLTKINLKIALEILLGAIVQIVSKSSLASKGINIREGVIDAGYTEDITIMLQNKTDKPFKIEHAEKIAQAIYLPLINILGLQSVNNREQLRKNERRMQGFGSTGQFTVPINIALNIQNESHQIL